MEIKKYFSLAKKWTWLLIVGLVLSALSSLLVSINIKAVYAATTKVLTTRAGQSSNTDSTFLSEQQLTQTYVQLVSSESVLLAVSERLHLEIKRSQIEARQIGSTQIIQITVEDQNPARAAQIANAYVMVLIEKNEELQAGRYATMEESLLAQKLQIETQIEEIQAQVDQTSVQAIEEQKLLIESQIESLQSESSHLQAEIANASSATLEEQADLEGKRMRLSQIQPMLALYEQSYANLVVYGQLVEGVISRSTSALSLLQTTQGLYQQIYLSILRNLEDVRLARLQNTPNVVQIEPALIPGEPVRPQPLQNTILGGMVGLMITLGVVFLKEYLDDTLKTPEEIEQHIGQSVIGYISEVSGNDGSEGNIYVARKPRSPISEAFRTLRTNLEFAGVENPLKIIAITSPGASEGKTTISCNLAASIAQGGKRVILVDADLRRPRVHHYTGISNQFGLTDVFLGRRSLQAVKRQVDEVDNLSVITSGNLPPNPAELLGSTKMIKIFEELKTQADVVVVDCPPSLVTDSQILSAKADGVLVVIQPGFTHIGDAKMTVEQLNRVGAKIVGVVLNRIPRDSSYYYGGYNYYSSARGYHYDDSEDDNQSKKRSTKVANIIQKKNPRRK